MYRWIKASVLLAALLGHTAVATQLSHKEYQRFTNGELQQEGNQLHERAKGNLYIDIAKGLFNSKGGNIIQNAASIPCDVIGTLETDAYQAEQFVNQIQAGQVPSIITDLPEEAISQFSDIIDVATMVLDAAESVITDVASIFDDIEDGSITDIVSDIEAIPTDIINDITEGWNDFTSDIESIWGDVTCFLAGDCPSTPSSAGFCAVPTSAAASATPAAVSASATSLTSAAMTSPAPSQNQYSAQTPTLASQSTPTLAPTPASQITSTLQTSQPTQVPGSASMGALSYDWERFNILALAALMMFGIALWL